MSNPYGDSFGSPAYPPEMLGYQPQMPLKHSELGIAAVIVGALVMVEEVAAFVWAVYLAMHHVRNKDQSALVGFLVCGGLALAVVGAILGLVGLFVGRRKRIFAALGLFINGLVLAGMIGLIVYGLSKR